MNLLRKRAIMPVTALLGGAAVAAFLASGGIGRVKAQPAATMPLKAPISAEACIGLASLKLAGVEIVSASNQLAGVPVAGARLPGMNGNPGEGSPATGLPAFCRVAGRIHPEAGSNIGFEVWMPSAGWDGRLHGIGIGGFAGSIDYLTLGLALKAGQAAVATDTGHQGNSLDSSWARGHPERVRDYGWRAIHESTVAAKQLIRTFYQRGPDHSYFVGCSGGGRQGLMEAARFPEDYDGVVAGAPAASFTELVLGMVNPLQAQLPPGAAIRPEQVRLIQSEVLGQCDAADGQVDGLVADPRQCHLDVARLACGVSSSSQCFSAPQLAALRRIYAGPRDASGRQLAGAFLPSGSEPGNPVPPLGWEGYLLARPGGLPAAQLLAGGVLQDLIQQPFATTASFDFDRDTSRLRAAMAPDMDASPDLQHFFARGGKLIMYHGWADAAIPPENSLRYRMAMLRNSGPKAQQSFRLFMVPDMQHCLGGTGPDEFGQMGPPKPGEKPERNVVMALQAWVEGHRPAPEALIGRRGLSDMMGMPTTGPERQRLLCAWPGKAVLKSGGDPDKAASYSCQPASTAHTAS
jgi:pimeloyl-ACP methyl ester carboxylesterase